jgi:hypothetical protein
MTDTAEKAKAKSRKIMRQFSLHEISAVTVPAQEGARMVLMKRADAPATVPAQGAGGDTAAAGGGDPDALDLSKLSADERAELIVKGRLLLTEEFEGHCHLVDVGPYAQERGGGNTDCCSGEDYHSHPYVIGEGGTITIGKAKGHTHAVMSLAKVKEAALAASPVETQKGDEMDQKEANTLRALAVMNDAQKAHYGKLSTAAQEAFVALTPEQRAGEVTKAAEADGVVYTAKNGAEYRKSDDPRLVQMAKDRDADMIAAEVAKEAALSVEAGTLAASWGFMSKSMEEKTNDALAILRASPEARKAALEAIEAARKLAEPLFKSIGTVSGAAPSASSSDADEAEAELSKLAEDYAAKHDVTYEAATVAVLDTRKGKQLYAKANPRATAH